MGKAHKSEAQTGRPTYNLVHVKSTEPNPEIGKAFRSDVASEFIFYLNTIIF